MHVAAKVILQPRDEYGKIIIQGEKKKTKDYISYLRVWSDGHELSVELFNTPVEVKQIRDGEGFVVGINQVLQRRIMGMLAKQLFKDDCVI